MYYQISLGRGCQCRGVFAVLARTIERDSYCCNCTSELCLVSKTEGYVAGCGRVRARRSLVRVIISVGCVKGMWREVCIVVVSSVDARCEVVDR